MSDPRKTFVCFRGHKVNDAYRTHGDQTPCGCCIEMEDDFIERIKHIIKDKIEVSDLMKIRIKEFIKTLKYFKLTNELETEILEYLGGD